MIFSSADDFLRQLRSPRNLLWFPVALIPIGLIAYLTPNYQPELAAFQLRYLESDGRSPAQLEQKAAQTKAAEEAKQRQIAADNDRAAELKRREEQRAAEAMAQKQREEQQRAAEAAQRATLEAQKSDLQARYPLVLASYRKRVADVPKYTGPLVSQAQDFEHDLEAETKQPGFYAKHELKIETTATMAACNNQGAFLTGTNKNLYTCLVHLAINSRDAQQNAKARHIMQMTLERVIKEDGANDDFPFSIIVLYSWMETYGRALATLDTSELPATFPALISGSSINRELIKAPIPAGFAGALIDTATDDEKIHLRDTVYPFLQTVNDEVMELVNDCRALSIQPCVPR